MRLVKRYTHAAVYRVSGGRYYVVGRRGSALRSSRSRALDLAVWMEGVGERR